MKNSLLLHVCCGGCLTQALHHFNKEDSIVSSDHLILYYDNSNIHPRTEWVERLDAVKTVASEYGLKLIVADWSPKNWYAAINHNPDNSNLRRCKACWKMRLGNTAEKARKIKTPNSSSTLLSSKYQSRKEIIQIGEAFAEDDLEFVPFSVEKDCDAPKSIYLQNYCGCVYSLVERYEEKHQE